MKRLLYFAALPAVPAALIVAGLSASPPARAECVSTGATTLCGQGDVRGGGGGQGPGPIATYDPYICGYDGDCDDGGWYFDLDPGYPGRPGIGGPGGPGGVGGIGGPGGPGGIGGGGGGGRGGRR